jgi:hypothetical protein
MSVLLDAYNLICAQNNPMGFNEDFVFLHYVPETLEDGTKSEDAPVLVRVTHIQNERDNFASNISNSLSTSLQVQVWFNIDDPLADQYDDILAEYMEDNGFYPMDTSNLAKDPDVDKLFLTAKFKKTNFK